MGNPAGSFQTGPSVPSPTLTGPADGASTQDSTVTTGTSVPTAPSVPTASSVPTAQLDISVVIPAKDEAATIQPLIAEIVASMGRLPHLTYEILYIDDGSTDGTWDQLVQACRADERVKAMRFRRNFGKAAALSAGLEKAAGRIIITMDADMQDDPNELPRMLAEIDNGYDLCTGFKENRKDPLGKRLPSKLFNRATGAVTGLKLNDHNSGLRVGYREIYDTIPLYGELHRYVPALAHANGFRVTELPVHHRARTYGKSKYGLERYARGALDLLTVVSITRYGRRPSHLLGGIGIVFGLVGAIILLVLAGEKIFGGDAIGARPLLQLGILLVILAVQLIGMGLLAELVINRTDPSMNTSAPIVTFVTHDTLPAVVGGTRPPLVPAHPADHQVRPVPAPVSR